MKGALAVTLCQTFDRKPLAIVDGLPGGGADLTPAQLRALADALLRIAADAEARSMGPRAYLRHQRTYTLGTPHADPA